jgi:hypothetical protein
MGRFSKTCLLLIVLLLAVIALRPVITPTLAQAQQHHEFTWKAFPANQIEDKDQIQPFLKDASAKGWDLAGVAGNNTWFLFVLRK